MVTSNELMLGEKKVKLIGRKAKIVEIFVHGKFIYFRFESVIA